MTSWNVYTIGSLDFIYGVFNAVAMLMNSGTFSDMFRIAALLGVIGVVISSAISAGKSLSFQNMAVCIVMYMLFFQVSARVNIEDVTTGSFKAVDNVPAGLAASASIISTVGYTLTEKMEQAFSTPSMTEYGSLDPLISLSMLYDTLKDPMRWSVTAESKSHLQASVINYMKDCVTNDIIRGAASYSRINRSSLGVAGATSSDGFQRVLIYDNLGDGWQNQAAKSSRNESIYPCNQAYTKLNNQLRASAPTLDNSYNDSLAAIGRTCSGSKCTGTSKIQDVMNFYNIQSTDMRDFQMTMLMYPYLKQVPIYGAENSFRGSAAITRSQTMTQQAFQWASSGSSFLSWMTSFMPIFQGVIYSLAPFMAFLLGLGIMGLRLVLKYLLVCVWTQTWMPLAAIVNFYVLTKMQTEASAVLTSGQLTFTQLYSLLYNTQRNIGLAGNLFSMIPALGGFIVWGSSIAFNSLANSAAAPHAGDTKGLAPDLANAPAINSRSSDTSYNRSEGTTRTGASGVVPAFDMKQMASANESSARQRMEQSSVQMTAASAGMINHVANQSQTGTAGRTYSDASQAMLANLSSSDRATVHDVAQRNNVSDMEALVGMANGQFGVSGGVSAKGGNDSSPLGGAAVSVGATGSMNRSNTETQGISNDQTKSYGGGESSRQSRGDSETLSRIVNSAGQAGYSVLKSSGVSSSATQSFNAAESKLSSDQQSYQSAKQYNESTSMGQSMKATNIAQNIAGSTEAKAALTQVLAGHSELTQGIQEDTARLSALGMTESDAHTFAQFKAAVSLGQAGEVAKHAGFVTGSTNQPELTSNAARENSSIAQNAVGAGGRAESRAGGIQGQISANEAGAAQGVSDAKNVTSSEVAGGKVREHNASNQREVWDAGQAHQDDLAITAADTAARGFMDQTSYRLDGPVGAIQAGADYVREMFTSNQDYSKAYGSAMNEASSVNGVSSEYYQDAKEAIASYYAGTKSGMDSDQMDQLRGNVMAKVMLATGGGVDAYNQISGGNKALAEGIIGRIDETARDPQRDDVKVVNQAVTSLKTSLN